MAEEAVARVSVLEAESEMDVSHRTVYNLIESGRVSAIRDAHGKFQIDAASVTKMSDWLKTTRRMTDAAKDLGCCRRHLYNLIATGKLITLKDGHGHQRVSKQSIKEYKALKARPDPG